MNKQSYYEVQSCLPAGTRNIAFTAISGAYAGEKVLLTEGRTVWESGRDGAFSALVKAFLGTRPEASPMPTGVYEYEGTSFYMEELFREKGTTVPKTFARVFEINEDYYFDRDGDGTTDRICVSASPENGRYKKADVSLNGQSVLCLARADRFVPMIMETGDGLWLYLACEENEGPGEIAVVDLSKDPPIFLGVPTQDTGIPYLKNEDGWTETLPGDPMAFLLQSTVDLITSFPAVAEYKVGTDGVPVQTGKVYTAYGETVLESLAKMKVDLIDPDTGETVEKGRIFEAGSRWTVVRSDGETYIDFDVNGEGLVRLSGDSSGTWPEKIGGTAVGKLFKEVSDNS